jgi:hypothetical protein
LIVALLLEAGLLLILIPWSTFWDRNYFGEAVPSLHAVLTNNFVRGGVSGLGLVNVLAALGELSDLFLRRRQVDRFPEEASRLGGGRAG